MRSTTWGVAAALIVLGSTARAQTMVDLTAAQGVANAAGATSGMSASHIINDVRARIPAPQAGWSDPGDVSHGGGGKTAWVTAGDLGSRSAGGGGGRSAWMTPATAVAHAGGAGTAWLRAADGTHRAR
jgi:hypothetical protein